MSIQETTDPDAPHEEPSIGYIPALDGLRALAVLGVMAFHGGISFLGGGFLGVDTFFVLSGFLITTLLIAEWNRIDTIRLGMFWARRARRLLPGLFAMLLFVAWYAAFIAAPGSYPNLRLDALSSLFYVANWHFILIGSNYFNQAGMPSPLTHTWSLAIEEQFYLVWPLIVLVVLKYSRGLKVLLGVCIVGALASASEMALLYRPGMNTTRLYYGTDTHAQSLLVGATLAVVLAMVASKRSSSGSLRPRGAHRLKRVFRESESLDEMGAPIKGRRGMAGDVGVNPGSGTWMASSARVAVLLNFLGFLGLGVSALLWWKMNGNQAFAYRGGFFIAAVSSACILVAVVCVKRSPIAVLLSVSPLRYLGRISYGMYLWHYPLFIWLNEQRTGLSGYWLFGFRVLVTVVVATASFYLLERPIRQGSFFRMWRAWLVTPIAVALLIVAIFAATELPSVAAVPLSKIPTSSASEFKGPPVRTLIVGDSLALTLGMGMSLHSIDSHYDVVEDDQGIIGCGVVDGTRVELQGVISSTADACNPSVHVPANSPEYLKPWPQQWSYELKTFKPNVVVLLAGRWETVNRTYKGKWTNIMHPTFAAYVKHQLEYAVQLGTSTGARMVFLTSPCYEQIEQPNGQPWPEELPARQAVYNKLLTEVAAMYPKKVTIVNLNAMVCPDGKYSQDLHGVDVRTPSDGVHFTIAGGAYLAPQLWPPIVKVGREQMAELKKNTQHKASNKVVNKASSSG